MILPFWINAGAPPAFQFSVAKLPRGVSFVSPLLPALFLPRPPRLQAASSHEIAHMQAGQCGTKFLRGGDVRQVHAPRVALRTRARRDRRTIRVRFTCPRVNSLHARFTRDLRAVYRWIGIYRGTCADPKKPTRSEANDPGTSVIGQVGLKCTWFPCVRFPGGFEGAFESENLKKSPCGRGAIRGDKKGK